jgi:hypothetical protein
MPSSDRRPDEWADDVESHRSDEPPLPNRTERLLH